MIEREVFRLLEEGVPEEVLAQISKKYGIHLRKPKYLRQWILTEMYPKEAKDADKIEGR